MLAAEPDSFPRAIESILPNDEVCRKNLVESYLQHRGITPSKISFTANPWDNLSLSDRIAQATEALGTGKRLLLLIYERECGDTGTFRYFGYNVYQRLIESDCWHGTILFIDELENALEIIERSSAISLIRCRIRPELVRLAELAKQRDIPIAYTMDDDALGTSKAAHIIDLMANNPDDPFERAFWTGVTHRFQLAADLTDAFFAPSAYYARILEDEQRKPAFVTHSSLNDEQIAVLRAIQSTAKAKHDDSAFIVGYFSGTSSHQSDFALVRDAIIQFLSEHDDARLLLCGKLLIDQQLYTLYQHGQIILLPLVDYATLQYVQSSVDVSLAPLVVNAFTNCKSGLKVFEAGAVGVPSCASPAFAYQEAIKHGETGFICGTNQEWLEALNTLYRDRNLTERMGKAAKSRSLNMYYGNAIREEIEHACNQLQACKCEPIPNHVYNELEGKAELDWDNPFISNPAFAD